MGPGGGLLDDILDEVIEELAGGMGRDGIEPGFVAEVDGFEVSDGGMGVGDGRKRGCGVGWWDWYVGGDRGSWSGGVGAGEVEGAGGLVGGEGVGGGSVGEFLGGYLDGFSGGFAVGGGCRGSEDFGAFGRGD